MRPNERTLRELVIDRRRVLKAGIVTAGIAAAGAIPGTAAAREPGWADASFAEQLRTVRDASGSYRRLDAMADAGYVSSPLPLVCGLGYVFDNLGHWDGSPDPDNPESLFYVLNEGGKLELAGVELIRVTDVDANGDPVDPKPDLFNDEEVPVEDDPLRGTTEADGWIFIVDPATGMGLWVLHVWVHERNPDGIFTPRNPRFADMPGCGTLG